MLLNELVRADYVTSPKANYAPNKLMSQIEFVRGGSTLPIPGNGQRGNVKNFPNNPSPRKKRSRPTNIPALGCLQIKGQWFLENHRTPSVHQSNPE